jgi:hypothetical protein
VKSKRGNVSTPSSLAVGQGQCMRLRIKRTTTVYPCFHRSPNANSVVEKTTNVWMTWEAIEREYFNPHGALTADFSKPLEVDPDLVRDHRYMPSATS